MRIKRQVLAAGLGILMVAGTPTAVSAGPMSDRASSVPAPRAETDEHVCTGEADDHTPGETYTAPAPTKCDRPGTDQDGYYIPQFTHPDYNFGDYRVGGKTVGEGFHPLKNGASSVVVTTDYDSGSWTFNFTDANVKQEAENAYGIEVSDVCKKSTVEDMYREVWWSFTNVLESELPPGVTEGRMVHSIFPRATTAEDRPAYDTPYVNRIIDGQTVRLPFLQDNDTDGLRPGTWKVVFWRADSGPRADYKKDYVVKRMKIVVPSCKNGGSGPGDPSSSFNVSGSIRKLGCTRVKVVADAREHSGSDVKFKVTKRLKGQPARQRSLTVRAGTLGRLVVKKPKAVRAKFVLQAKEPGRGWVRLARKSVPAC